VGDAAAATASRTLPFSKVEAKYRDNRRFAAAGFEVVR
jgi:hypothetical protein